MPADYVLYDYIGIEAIADDLSAANANAATLLGTGNTQRAALAVTWQGASLVAFEDAYSRFSIANTNIISSTAAAIAALEDGNAQMATVEATYAGGFV